MKRSDLLTGAALATMLLAIPVVLTTPADAQQSRRHTTTTTTTTSRETVSVQVLRERLQPEGEFVRIAKLGEVWRPRDVDRDWQPYTNGRWIFNQEVGWYFESDEPWAEVTYHYGRWYDDPDEGWVWVPGTEWAPAWVEWRRTRDHVGWRPLPPDNAPRRVSVRRGGRGDTGYDVTEIQEEWVFVPTREITTERITTVRVEPSRVVEIYREARPLGRVERRGGYAVNFALQPRVIEREANIQIRSQNIPRAEAVPVPQQVRSIATEQRTTTTRRAGQDANRPAASDTERPGQPPRPGQADTTKPGENDRNRPASAESTRPGQPPRPGQADAAKPGEQRPGQNQADRTREQQPRDATGSVRRPGDQENSAARPGDTKDDAKASDNGRKLPQGAANSNAGGQDRGQNRAEQRRPPQGAANTNAGGQDRGPARAEQRRPEQAGEARKPMPDTTGSTRPQPRPGGGDAGPAMRPRGGGEQAAPRPRGSDANPAAKRKLPGAPAEE